MYAIKAIYDGINFKPVQPIPVEGNYEVVITFIEPVEKSREFDLPYKRGCMKGKMWMSDDFDAPLEDFKEYMELSIYLIPTLSCGILKIQKNLVKPQ